jgi:hypothetical protein
VQNGLRLYFSVSINIFVAFFMCVSANCALCFEMYSLTGSAELISVNYVICDQQTVHFGFIAT